MFSIGVEASTAEKEMESAVQFVSASTSLDTNSIISALSSPTSSVSRHSAANDRKKALEALQLKHELVQCKEVKAFCNSQGSGKTRVGQRKAGGCVVCAKRKPNGSVEVVIRRMTLKELEELGIVTILVDPATRSICSWLRAILLQAQACKENRSKFWCYSGT